MKINEKKVGEVITVPQGPLAGREATIGMVGDHVVVVDSKTGERRIIRGDMEVS